MMTDKLSVLIHQGELEQIRHYINQSKREKTCVGDLYGLWRNSFEVPVIQFVTAPPSSWQNTNTYRQTCNHVIHSQHSLRRIGIWTSVKTDYGEITGHVIKDYFRWYWGREEWERVCDPSYFLVMLVTGTSQGETLTANYYLWDMSKSYELPRERQVDEYSADVLPGNSSFRLYEPLTSALSDGALTSILPVEFNIKAAGEVMKISSEQWYSSDWGMDQLRMLNEHIMQIFPNAGLSSDSNTNNIGFNLVDNGKEYLLEFPRKFPEDSACLKPADGRTQINISLSPEQRKNEHLVKTLITTLLEIIHSLAKGEEKSTVNQMQGKHNGDKINQQPNPGVSGPTDKPNPGVSGPIGKPNPGVSGPTGKPNEETFQHEMPPRVPQQHQINTGPTALQADSTPKEEINKANQMQPQASQNRK